MAVGIRYINRLKREAVTPGVSKQKAKGIQKVSKPDPKNSALLSMCWFLPMLEIKTLRKTKSIVLYNSFICPSKSVGVHCRCHRSGTSWLFSAGKKRNVLPTSVSRRSSCAAWHHSSCPYIFVHAHSLTQYRRVELLCSLCMRIV